MQIVVPESEAVKYKVIQLDHTDAVNGVDYYLVDDGVTDTNWSGDGGTGGDSFSLGSIFQNMFPTGSATTKKATSTAATTTTTKKKSPLITILIIAAIVVTAVIVFKKLRK